MNFIEHVLEPQKLLLVWQGPEGSTRSRRTVAELARQDDEQVRFRYLFDSADFKAAQREGFIDFPAFRKLDQTYDVGVLETFMRRLPPRSRGDYAEYLKQFRLRSDTQISDFALLAYTGAKLPSDGFSIINPLEDVVSDSDVLVEIAGFRYNSRLDANELQFGEPVSFAAEPGNLHDPNAVAVLVRDQRIGYVPRQQANAIRRFCVAGTIHAQVERINGRSDRPLVYLFVALRPAAAHSLNATCRVG